MLLLTILACSIGLTLKAQSVTNENSSGAKNADPKHKILFDDGLPNPKADFTYTATYTNVIFMDQSSNELYIITWLWDFGDGSPTGTTPNPEHTYTAPGVYQVKLTVRSADYTSTIIKPVRVTDLSNQAPVTAGDIGETNKNSAVNIPAAANDNTTDGPDIKYSIVSQAKHGSAAINPSNGTVSYNPGTDYTGNDTISYRLCDGAAPELCSTSQIIITVHNIVYINQPPLAGDDEAETDMNTAALLEASGNDDMTDGPQAQYSIVNDPRHGNAVMNIASGTIMYTPDSSFYGHDTLSYQICDGANPELCDTARVVIAVKKVNQAPIANDDMVFMESSEPVKIYAAVNDYGTDGPYAVYELIMQPENGSAVIDAANGEVTYTPEPAFYGQDTLMYKLCDGGSPELCDEAFVFIEIQAANQAPRAENDLFTAICDQAEELYVLANDFDIDGNLDPASIISFGTSNGTVTANPEGTLTYTAVAGFTGMDSLTYRVFDNMGAMSNEATVHISVDCATGIADADSERFSIVPNPASDELSVHMPDNIKSGKINIFSLQGDECYHSDEYVSGIKIDMQELPSGVYLVKIETEKGIVVKKCTVIR